MSFLKNVPSSYLWAGGMVLAATVWVGSGVLSGGHQGEDGDATLAEASEKVPTSVRVRTFVNEPHAAELALRGRTEAELKVQVKAETAGRVAAVPGLKGQRVKAGDPICQLDVGTRQAKLDEAKAQLRQARLEYEAAVALEKKGHRSETQTAAALAAFEAAEANIRGMEQELSFATMRAPFDGVIDNRYVQVGDYMTPGAPCAWVVGSDPFHVVGAVAEAQISHVKTGTPGTAKLVTGETVDGTVTFVSSAADAATRTFRLELTVPNTDMAMRDGVTAEIRIKSKTVPAMRLSPAILSLGEGGKVGVKIVENNKVRFVEVAIIADNKDGVWVAGLPDVASVITVGQEYVRDGEDVKAVEEAPVTADGSAAPSSSAN
jgi:multidrug efflux system membrane fusion protein